MTLQQVPGRTAKALSVGGARATALTRRLLLLSREYGFPIASPSMASCSVSRGLMGGYSIARGRVLSQLSEVVPSSSSSSALSVCNFSNRPGESEESQSKFSQNPSSSFPASVPSPQVVIKKVSDAFRNAASSTGDVMHRMREAKLVDSVRTGYTFLKEEMNRTSPQRKPKYSAPDDSAVRDIPPVNTTVNSIVPVVKKTTGWEKRWEDLKKKAKSHPAFKRFKTVTGHPVVTKGQELAEDIRERWETSDSPVVHRIQDMNESLFGETATAVAMREIRRHDPSFTFSDFLAEMQEEIRPTLRAYLKGDVPTLKKKCCREVLERCQAERSALESQGIFLSNEILHISDIEIKETKLLGNSPIIIINFQTQQIHCARDKAGNIIEGARDDIHTVFYAWAMQQESPEETSHGEFQTRWKLREMQQAGIQALI
ncbi:mitochondrial import inner membrane translocase subunit TIM44-2 [Physcomitrium patens]|uniref:Tim44-like domain-containing protein n=1 Tax=Physcomitrium patens TaxID=3218 RepID=A9S8R1_PHYPA|nr:mitochondrial import inner membrane translocase subunit TIM44-2-like [Physcomitrium patens]PNR43551.1 hypothetical protein PHYPA_015932 [Physcomitrium patens]|eukprot:XP_024389939.1 mitochondrial import inner membrane translocase subunit TIM44-2-like [Physcomitrella patens]